MKNLLFLLLLQSMTLFAQKEGNIWYFGNRVGLNFNAGSDFLLTDSNMRTFEGSASICDVEGNLLFYTNGGGRISNNFDFPSGQIWNKNHESIYDMQGLEGGGFSSDQSSIFLPKPNTPGHYYLFTMDEEESASGGASLRGFSYFEIDAEAQNGFGEVINYQEVFTETTENLAICKHTNNSDYWIIIPEGTFPTTEVRIYALTESGLSLSSTYEFFDAIGFGNFYYTDFKFSPDGTKFIGQSVLFDFDASTGVLSNPLYIGYASPSVSFSANSQYLYATEVYTPMPEDLIPLLRYNLQAEDILASAEEITTYEQNENFQVSDMQLGPDGNIYLLEGDFSNLEHNLSVIKCANSSTPCFERNILAFPSSEHSYLNLTDFPGHYFENNNENIELEIAIENTPFQDCEEQGAVLEAMHHLANDFVWSTGETGSEITVTQPGIYSVSVTDGCCSEGYAEIEVLPFEFPPDAVEIIGNLELCPDQATELSAVYPEALFYTWSTGETGSSISITEAGTYAVTVEDACENTAIGSVEVVWSESTLVYELPASVLLNCNDPAVINLETNATTIVWSTGETGANITVSSPGLYSVSLSNSCQTLTEDIQVLQDYDFFVPNIFSPNNDGVNDFFSPAIPCFSPINYSFRIFSRWGEEVFYTEEYSQAWSGEFRGEQMPVGLYIYTLEFFDDKGKVIRKNGDVSLVR